MCPSLSQENIMAESKQADSFDKTEAIRLADIGKSMSEIAEILEVSYYTLYKFFRSNDFLITRWKRKSSNRSPKHDLIIILAKQKLSLSEISRLVGISREAVRLVVKKSGLPTDVRVARMKDRADRVKTLADQGKNCQEISDDTGLPYNVIRSIAKDLGLKILGNSILTFDGDKAIELAREGFAPAEIADKLGTRYYNVLNFLHRRGIEIVSGYERNLTFDSKLAATLALQKIPLRQIVERTGGNINNVRFYFERHDIPYVRDRIPPGHFEQETSQAREMLQQKNSVQQIAEKMRYTEECVNKLLGSSEPAKTTSEVVLLNKNVRKRPRKDSRPLAGKG